MYDNLSITNVYYPEAVVPRTIFVLKTFCKFDAEAIVATSIDQNFLNQLFDKRMLSLTLSMRVSTTSSLLYET